MATTTVSEPEEQEKPKFKILLHPKDHPFRTSSGYSIATRYLIDGLHRDFDIGVYAPVGQKYSVEYYFPELGFTCMEPTYSFIMEDKKEYFSDHVVPIYPGINEGMGEDLVDQHYQHFNAEILLFLGDIWGLTRLVDLCKQDRVRMVASIPVDFLNPIPKYIVEKCNSALYTVVWVKDGFDRLKEAGVTNLYPSPVPLGLNCNLWKPVDRSEYGSTMQNLGFGYDTFNISIVGANQYQRKCLTAGAKVHTTGGVKRIEEVVVGDSVLTHKGRYRTVKEVSSAPYNGSLVTIKSQYSGLPLEMTDDHPVLAVKRQSIRNLTNFKRRRESVKWNPDFYKATPPRWIKAGELEKGDFVVVPRLTEDVPVTKLRFSDYLEPNSFFRIGGDNQRIRVSKRGRPGHRQPYGAVIDDEIPVDGDFMRLCGYYLAEGFATKGGISFAFHEREIETYVEDIQEVMSAKTGLKLYLYHSSRTKGVRVNFYNRLVKELFTKLFGTGAKNKSLPEWFLALPDEKLWELVKGLWRGDGWKAEGGFMYTTVSEKLAHQLFLIFVKLGLVVSYRYRRVKYQYGTSHAYEFRIGGQRSKAFEDKMGEIVSRVRRDGVTPIHHTYNRGWVDDKYFYMPILKIEERKSYGDRVYNIEVDEDESFVSSFTVHNSWPEMLRGIQLFRERRPEVKVRLYVHTLLQIGEGYDIAALVDSIGLSDITNTANQYHVISGMYVESQIMLMHALADCVLNVGLEGWGYSTIQAQATGTPTIGLAVGATKDLVEAAVLVPPYADYITPNLMRRADPHPIHVADALEKVYETPRSEFQKGVSFVKENFDWPVVIPQWKKMLDSVNQELERRCIKTKRYPPEPSERALEMSRQMVELQ